MDHTVLHPMRCVPSFNHAHHSERGDSNRLHASYMMHAHATVNQPKPLYKPSGVRTKEYGYQAGVVGLLLHMEGQWGCGLLHKKKRYQRFMTSMLSPRPISIREKMT